MDEYESLLTRIQNTPKLREVNEPSILSGQTLQMHDLL